MRQAVPNKNPSMMFLQGRGRSADGPRALQLGRGMPRPSRSNMGPACEGTIWAFVKFRKGTGRPRRPFGLTGSIEGAPIEHVDASIGDFAFYGLTQADGVTADLQRHFTREGQTHGRGEPVVHAFERVLAAPDSRDRQDGGQRSLVINSYVHPAWETLGERIRTESIAKIRARRATRHAHGAVVEHGAMPQAVHLEELPVGGDGVYFVAQVFDDHIGATKKDRLRRGAQHRRGDIAVDALRQPLRGAARLLQLGAEVFQDLRVPPRAGKMGERPFALNETEAPDDQRILSLGDQLEGAVELGSARRMRPSVPRAERKDPHGGKRTIPV